MDETVPSVLATTRALFSEAPAFLRPGWEFVMVYPEPYPEPEPTLAGYPDAVRLSELNARTNHMGTGRRSAWSPPTPVQPGKKGLTPRRRTYLLVLLVSFLISSAAPAVGSLPLLVVLVWILERPVRNYSAKQAAASANAKATHWLKTRHDAWSLEKSRWDSAETDRVQSAPLFYPVPVPQAHRRVVVFGGTDEGHQDLLATLIAPLCRDSFAFLDLSGRRKGAKLVQGAQEMGRRVTIRNLPNDIATLDLFTNVSNSRKADVLVSALTNADSSSRSGAREEALLQLLIEELGDNVTVPRLLAAVRVALGLTSNSWVASTLTPQEILEITNALPDEYRHSESELLAGLRGELERVKELGSSPETVACDIEVFALENPSLSSSPLIGALLVLSFAELSQTRIRGGVAIAGADSLSPVHIDILISACERKGIPLILQFNHFTDQTRKAAASTSTSTLFMALPDEQEAQAASAFVGDVEVWMINQHSDSTANSITTTFGSSESFSVTMGMTQSESNTTGSHNDTAFGQVTTTGSSEALVVRKVLEARDLLAATHREAFLLRRERNDRPGEAGAGNTGRQLVHLYCNPELAAYARTSPRPRELTP